VIFLDPNESEDDMKTLRAVNTIVMTLEPGKAGDKAKGIPPVRPKTVEIKPKTRFKAQNQDQENDLLAQGAAVVAEPLTEDVVTETVVTTEAKPKATTKAEKAAAAAAAAAEKAAAEKTAADDGDDDGADDGDDDGKDLV
jgi:cell division protein FtsN